jgi:hypothetical protein
LRHVIENVLVFTIAIVVANFVGEYIISKTDSILMAIVSAFFTGFIIGVYGRKVVDKVRYKWGLE